MINLLLDQTAGAMNGDFKGIDGGTIRGDLMLQALRFFNNVFRRNTDFRAKGEVPEKRGH